MKCIICDRCRTIITPEDKRRMRVITSARPLNPMNPIVERGDDRQFNEHIWTRELCPSCADELDAFMESAGGAGGGAVTGGGTVDPAPAPDPTE